jgi:hypothetical protein
MNVAAVNRTRGSCMASTNFTTKPLRLLMKHCLVNLNILLTVIELRSENLSHLESGFSPPRCAPHMDASRSPFLVKP